MAAAPFPAALARVVDVPAFSPASLGERARSTEARRASMRSTVPTAFGAGSALSPVSPARGGMPQPPAMVEELRATLTRIALDAVATIEAERAAANRSAPP
ncbi:hypothetical protein [Streptomyces erythrochromogenes]|uniref:hypothetical protein n=1 Tax=Streptomyces erythrochromogenes TaxID=285574 RepID=UPI0036A762F2